MRENTLKQIASEFWESAGGPEPYPRQLEEAILWSLPLAIFKLPRLLVTDVQEWLLETKIPLNLKVSNRSLHACLIAYGGRGCLLLDNSDRTDELRFSLAHETAHFLLDYLYPRWKADNHVGPQILEVFDGLRAATARERIHAAVGGVVVGFHTHLMARRESGDFESYTIAGAEDNAERLALELLAPEEDVRQLVSERARQINKPPEEIAVGLLSQDFGIPHEVAEDYAINLYPSWRSRTVRQWLGLQREV